MSKASEIKQLAEEDLYTFARLVNPLRVYGSIHQEAYRFLQEDDFDQLMLLPRDHQKSHCIAVWCAWWIAKHPDTTILYVSGTEDLAVSQLGAIKMILESDIFRRYWPDVINPVESMRAEWSAKNIKVCHPLREKMGIRDRTVAARSIDGNITGLHCNVLVLDDIVVPANAYTAEGRNAVKAGYAQMSSVLTTGGITKAVGTRYHGDDIYNLFIQMEEEIVSEDGEITGTKKTFRVMQREVEIDGVFCYPREMHPVSKRWYGFNAQELARKRAKYFAASERNQFYSQYYNNPNQREDGEEITKFDYYEPKWLKYGENGQWTYKDKPLTVFAAGDLAYTDADTSDYTAFAVIGLDWDGFIYLLELDQFRTTKYQRMYEAIERLYLKWRFRKIRLETNAGANLVCEAVKDLARKDGHALIVEGKAAKGDKNERCSMILRPRYENKTILHMRGGYVTAYEEQVLNIRPTHDDLRDAVAAAVEISKPPIKQTNRGNPESQSGNVVSLRFGGNRR